VASEPDVARARNWISTALADFPLASIVISGVVTTVLVAGVSLIDRRRHPSDVQAALVADSRTSGAQPRLTPVAVADGPVATPAVEFRARDDGTTMDEGEV